MQFGEEDLELILRALAHYTPALLALEPKAIELLEYSEEDYLGELPDDEVESAKLALLKDEVSRSSNIANVIMRSWLGESK